MRIRSVALPLLVLLALPAGASTGLTRQDRATLEDSVKTLTAVAGAAEESIPRELLAKADCILIFPSVSKWVFIAGGGRGNGVASCRQPDGKMGSTAFYTVGGASVGFETGQTADVVMLVMNEGGKSQMLAERFTVGADAMITTGPVGRTAAASSDAQRNAQILCWSRSRGAFLEMAPDGTVVKPDEAANARLYGAKTSGRAILEDSSVTVPAAAQPLVDSIRDRMPGAAVPEGEAAK